MTMKDSLKSCTSKNACILDFIGNTPLVEMKVDHGGVVWRFLAKLEFMNPTGSVKDRIAKYIIERAERRGELKKDSVIVEATSGNTGIGLAMVGAVKGYRVVIVMPEHMSVERRKIMLNFGAELHLTPVAEGFVGARDKTVRMAANDPKVFLPRQFENPDNTECHYVTTGNEIVQQLGGARIDAFVAGVGTGGTLMGVGRRLRETNPKCQVVAVEPAESAIISGSKDLGPHKIAGIGDGFIPELLDVSSIDGVQVIKGDDAICMAKKVCRAYGMMVGVSSGANILATINLLKIMGPETNLVTVLADRAERYFSTDLYECGTETNTRYCKKKCENPFCELRITGREECK